MTVHAPLVRSSPASPAALQELLREIHAYGVEHALSDQDLFAVKLALDELCTNLLHHGSLPGVEPRLRLRLDFDAVSLQFVFQDNGRRFDPTAAEPAPISSEPVRAVRVGGLGLTLIRGYVRTLSYRYEDGWNELRMEYDRRHAAVAPG